MPRAASSSQVSSHVSNIVSAYVSNHAIEATALPALILSVQTALAQLEINALKLPIAEKQQPAVPVMRNVYPDYIVCLEDGKKLKMLKRHLKAAYDMEPQEYRAKWGLPREYPMVAPSYAKERSSLAKAFGLGRKTRA